MYDFFDNVAERRIARALAGAEFDHLPGRYRPIKLDNDSLVPAEQRMMMRILKNAGCVPEAVQLRREIAQLTHQPDASAASDTDSDAKGRGRVARLQWLRIRLSCAG